MSGRRVKAQIKKTLQAQGKWFPDSKVILAGLANSYGGYFTTTEEYARQRYEGSSTLFGPHQVAIALQTFDSLATNIVTNTMVIPTRVPDTRSYFTSQPDYVPSDDTIPAGYGWGQIVQVSQNWYYGDNSGFCKGYGKHMYISHICTYILLFNCLFLCLDLLLFSNIMFCLCLCEFVFLFCLLVLLLLLLLLYCCSMSMCCCCCCCCFWCCSGTPSSGWGYYVDGTPHTYTLDCPTCTDGIYENCNWGPNFTRGQIIRSMHWAAKPIS
jgi:hypothetical protein